MLNNSVKTDRRTTALFLILLLVLGTDLIAQSSDSSFSRPVTVEEVVSYALKNQTLVEQARAGEEITALQIKSRLAAWYPQVNFNYLYQHNFQVQTNIIGGNPVRLGVTNTSAFQFAASQSIFTRDLLLANRTRTDVLEQAAQQTESTQIDVAAAVSKAFFDVLATSQQIRVTEENIQRLQRSLKDAKARYDAGVVDKTDYKRATIALNNATASLQGYTEILKAKQDYLKSMMNYPQDAALELAYDSSSLVQMISLDTLQSPQYQNRIEFRLLQTQQKLNEANVRYQRWSFLPSVSANGAYNLNYLNNSFGKLYTTSYPQSYAGLTLSFPIFQGGKRRYDIKAAEWQLKQTDLQLDRFKQTATAEYSNALAQYKASLASYRVLSENVEMAREVYDVIQLQYRAGIKTYLEVVTAETDLRTAQINYYNALYQVLSAKIDVLKSQGAININ